jgi:hypothetical protein
MSKNARISQIQSSYNDFKSKQPHLSLSEETLYPPFDGPSVEDCIEMIDLLIQTMDVMFREDLLKKVPWHAIQSLDGIFNALNQTATQFMQSRDQGSLQSFAMNLDSAIYHLRMFGVISLATGEGRLEMMRGSFQNELDLLKVSNKEAEDLKRDVRALIAPAVAGSLSEAFTARRNALLKGRVIWACVAGVGGIAGIIATFFVVSEVARTLDEVANSDVTVAVGWQLVLIRSIILVPLYAVFGFAFSQYKKERDFEEEYAHKAAVATSLPNYGDLARDQVVRDQIVTGATSVIFTSPTAGTRAKQKSEVTLPGVSQLIDSLAKLNPGKGAG